MLINAVKDVTSALGDLMQATKSASGKNMQHPAMHTLKDAAKVGLSGLAGKPLKKHILLCSKSPACDNLTFITFLKASHTDEREKRL